MEHTLSLKKPTNYKLFIALVSVGFISILLSFFIGNVYGLEAAVAILFFLILTPFIYKKYNFFLILWLFLVPLFDNFRVLLIAGTNPVVFIATGLTLPFSIILLLRKGRQVLKELPFLKYILVFQAVLLLNSFRPSMQLVDIVEVLKIYIEIFIIFCTYFYIKEGNIKTLINFISIFILSNCFMALFQRITGIGLTIVEGIPRVQGFLGHPNMLAFAINLYFPLAVYLFIKSDNKKEKKFLTLSILISSFCLLLTFCKSSLFIFAIQLLILFIFLPLKTKLRLTVGLSGLFILFLGIDAILQTKIVEYAANRLNNNSSYEWRLNIWRLLISGIKQSNILIGNGINSSKYFLGSFESNHPLFSHCVYLQYMYEYGLTSLAFYLSLFSLGFKHFKNFIFANKGNKIFNIFPLILILTILIDMYNSNNIVLRTSTILVWIIVTIFYIELNKSTINDQ